MKWADIGHDGRACLAVISGLTIGVRSGKVVNQYKVAKHFEFAIGETTFPLARNTDSIAAEAALDGFSIIRTSLPRAQMGEADSVRTYKSLAHVERAFSSLKTVDIKVRPIHHRLADRVRTHLFLCMHSYYVEWHMCEAWRELMFAACLSGCYPHLRQLR